MAEPTNHNDAGEVAPSTVEKQAPSVAEEQAPSSDEAVATDIPTANAPDPKTANPEANPNAATEKGAEAVSTPTESATQPPKSAGQPGAKKADAPPKGDQPAAAKAAKKEKAPAVEDKPFAEFIQQDYLPALQKELGNQGVQNLELNFEKHKVDIAGYAQAEDCWQVMGRWQNGGPRQFNLYFPEEDIQGQRAFSCNEGSKPSTLEPFLIDERKVTLDLMVFGVMQRLNGQKWLARN